MTLDDIQLGASLIWIDEFQHNQVAQEQDRTLTGALVVQEGQKHFGRPITLAEGWLPRSAVDDLYAKEAAASVPMSLTLDDGRDFSVLFDRTRGPAVEATPVQFYTKASQSPSWRYQITIRLITVEPEEE